MSDEKPNYTMDTKNRGDDLFKALEERMQPKDYGSKNKGPAADPISHAVGHHDHNKDAGFDFEP